MNPVFAAALEVQTFCRDQRWKFCFIGAVAVLDIEGIAVRQRGRLDERLIWAELAPLLELKEAPEAADRLRALLTRAAG